MEKIYQIIQEGSTDRVFDIQPYVQDDMLFQVYAISSVIVLCIITILKIGQNKQLLESFIPFLSSEQYSFDLFSSEEEQEGINFFLLLFCSLQFSYFYVQFPIAKQFIPLSDEWFFAVLAMSGTLFLMVKFAVFRSLEYLLPWRINMSYYLYNYRYALFVCTILYMIFHFTFYQPSLSSPLWLYLAPIVLFYAWLLLRWLFISLRYRIVRSLYFFLYLCTLEIAPLIILWYTKG